MKSPRASLRVRRSAVAATGVIAALAFGTLIAVPAANADPAPTTRADAMLAPYYTQFDLTGDKQITKDDLQVVSDHLGDTSTSADWSTVAAADSDSDGVITVKDLAAVSGRMIYDDGPFTLIEASTIDMQAAMNAGVINSVQLTRTTSTASQPTTR